MTALDEDLCASTGYLICRLLVKYQADVHTKETGVLSKPPQNGELLAFPIMHPLDSDGERDWLEDVSWSSHRFFSC